MMYTKQQLEEGVLKHVSAEAEDAVMEFLWARYQEDPEGAPSRYIAHRNSVTGLQQHLKNLV